MTQQGQNLKQRSGQDMGKNKEGEEPMLEALMLIAAWMQSSQKALHTAFPSNNLWEV